MLVSPSLLVIQLVCCRSPHKILPVAAEQHRKRNDPTPQLWPQVFVQEAVGRSHTGHHERRGGAAMEGTRKELDIARAEKTRTRIARGADMARHVRTLDLIVAGNITRIGFLNLQLHVKHLVCGLADAM